MSLITVDKSPGNVFDEEAHAWNELKQLPCRRVEAYPVEYSGVIWSVRHGNLVLQELC